MKKLSLCLALALLFSHQIASPLEGFLGKAVDATLDAARSDFAIKIYAGVCVTVGAVTAKTLIEPALAKYRSITGTESLNELHAKATLREKLIDLDQTDFQVQMVKMKLLAESFADYQAIMQKRLQEIKESNASEEEKKKLIAEVEARLKQTQANLDEANAKRFEALVASSSNQFKTRMLQKAKNA